jgi:hypothetical protein
MRLTKKWQHTLCRATLYLGAAGILAVTGCGDGKIGRNKINGSVNVDGKPTGGVMVIFCPVGGSPELQKMRPFGFTGNDGKFELTSVEKGDGAPEGQYKVLMQWPGTSGDARDGGGTMGPDKLKGRYMNLEKSQFTVDVEPGTNDLPPFELKSK